MDNKKMLQNVYRLLSGIVLLSLLFFQVGCDKSKAEEGENNSAEIADQAKKVNVRINTLVPTLFATTLDLVGEVEAVNDAILSGQVLSTLDKINIDKGRYIRQGDTLLTLDDKRSRAIYDLARSTYNNAEIDYNIARKQFEEGLGISGLQFKKVENMLLAAKSNLTNAEVDLENCFIIAPFNGEVAERYIDLGELVSPGSPLLRVINNSKLRIRTGVPENQYSFIANSAAVLVSVPALDTKLKGVISWIGASLEPKSRTVPIEISIPTHRNLKPGIMVGLAVEKSRLSDAIVIPLSVVQKAPDHSFVYLHSNGKARYRKVTIGSINQDVAMISAGLQFGDELIVDGYRDLVENQEILVVGKVEG